MKIADVTVVGGSLCGCFAAYLLGREGYRVRILDGGAVPGQKACGEGLSLIGKRYLEKAGIWEKIAPFARPFHGYDITFDDNRRISLDDESPVGYAVERRVIDQVVSASAHACPSVTVSQEAAVAIRRDGKLWIIETDTEEYRSAHILLACGAAGRRLIDGSGPQQSSKGKGMRYGMVIRGQGEWLDAPPSRVIIENRGNIQFLLTPFSEDRINISILFSKNHPHDRSCSKRALIDEASALAERAGMRGMTIDYLCGTSFVGSSRADTAPDGAYLAGDTAEVMDPIGGMGMSHALLSASLAAESIARSLSRPRHSARSWRRYIARRRRYSQLLRFATRLSYQLNVRQLSIIRHAVGSLPRFSQQALMALERLVPVGGLANRDFPRSANSVATIPINQCINGETRL